MTKKELRVIRNRIQKWVNALESGEFKRGVGALCCDDKYCCLGVAEEVCRLNEVSNSILTHTYNKLGLNTPNGDFTNRIGEVTCLVDYNDEKGYSFKKIATVIRSNPSGLFNDEVANYLKEFPLD